jgi:hypothetical protein
LTYLYAILPMLPTVASGAVVNFDIPDGFGRWWGFYCIDRGGWWRIGEPFRRSSAPRALR